MISLDAKSVDDFVWLVREFFGVENPCRQFELYPDRMCAKGPDFTVTYAGPVDATPELMADLCAAGVIFARAKMEVKWR